MEIKNKTGENLYLRIVKYEHTGDSYFVEAESELKNTGDQLYLIKEVEPVSLKMTIVAL